MDKNGNADLPPGNIFCDPIHNGKISSPAQLKRCFRVLAVKVHPDTSANRDGNDRFIKLEEDYREAQAFLSQPGAKLRAAHMSNDAFAVSKPSRKTASREQIYGDFFELEASNFPINLPPERRSKPYKERIISFNEEIAHLNVLGGKSFLDVECELYELREDWKLFDPIKNIFYNIVSWHIEPRDFTKQRIIEDFAKVELPLRETGRSATLHFLSWLIGDLENGSSLGPDFRTTIKNHQHSLK